MRPTYYQIELSGRMLTALLVALALLLVLAFAFGYGAAWSVLSARRPAETEPPVTATATPTATAVPVRTPTRAVITPPAAATAAPRPTSAPPRATATRTPRPTATPRPVRPSPTPVATVFSGPYYWVQVLAVSRRDAVDQGQARLEQLGYSRDHQRVVESPVAGGGILYKLRIGPFPNRESADRVMRRMQNAGFPDAWVVSP